jgi:hypothetical protein
LAGVHISSAFDIVLKDPQHCCAFHWNFSYCKCSLFFAV